MNIAIVDTNLERIELCKKVIDSLAGCCLSWVAMNPAEAIKKASLNTPNIMLVGLNLGQEVVEKVMNQNPTIILVMTSDLSAKSDQVFRVMGQGALDVVAMDLRQEKAASSALRSKMVLALMLMGTKKQAKAEPPAFKNKGIDAQYPKLIVVGASTGGPGALVALLKNIGKNSTLAFTIVQHVDEVFTLGFANWLGKQTGLIVEVARRGSRPQRGKVLIASSADHLVMDQNHQFHYTPYPIDKPYRPSVDVFFESVAHHWPEKATGVLLTGMGNDGALGMKKLLDAGWHTVVQDEKSSVVYGMPKAAIEMGAVCEVLTLEEMAALFSHMETRVC